MSDAHADDEGHVASPDQMYAKDAIVPACMECHKTPDRLVKKDDTACPRYHEEAVISKQVCTDCHGRHRLAERLVRWDKDTGERIWLDEKSPTKKKK